MKNCDPSGKQEIQDDLMSLERDWLQFDAGLIRKTKLFKNSVDLWDSTEAEIDQVLERLKMIQHSMQVAYPVAYGETEKELRLCKVQSIWLPRKDNQYLYEAIIIITIYFKNVSFLPH